MALKRRYKKLASTSFAHSLLYCILRLYSKMFHLTVENEREWLDYYLKGKGAVLICAYHQQFFPALSYFKKYGVYDPAVMVSQSLDGEIVSGVVKHMGWLAVRGSSSRGGRKALKEMIRHLSRHKLSAHVVDGPRGPARIIKPGIIRLAHMTNAVVVPYYAFADRAWYFNSWDRFFVPKPFSRTVIHFGNMIRFDETDNLQEFENQRLFLEDTMRRELSELKKLHNLQDARI